MLIFAIDDEPNMRNHLHNAIVEAVPEAEVLSYPSGTHAINAIEMRHLQPDVIFSDIMMPGLNGLELAVRLKTAAPEAKLVFVTAFSNYALNAFQVHAHGYIMKPVDAARIREELDRMTLHETVLRPERQLQIRCFGYFEVFFRQEPLRFARQQTKELLAFLVDRRGAYSSAEEIIAAIWEDEFDLAAGKHRLRNLISDLRKVLESIGLNSLLLRRRNQLAIRPELVDCDYYRMLSGDMEAVNAFCGEYMAQYSWAELTKGELYFRREYSG